MEVREILTKLTREAVNQVIGKDFDIEIKLEHPKEESFGDYSTNVALVSFGKLEGVGVEKKFAGPMKLAEEIVKRLIKESDEKGEKIKGLVEKIEAVKPGFINFYLSSKALIDELLLALNKGERYSASLTLPGAGRTMVLDHSHPNIAKRFGIGHLRSTIIGQAIINMYRFLGWKVIADNFLGDWGTQFGSLIVEIERLGGLGKLRNLDIDKLEDMYVDFNKRAKDDPELWELAKNAFCRLEEGDVEARKIWQKVKQISLEEFERIWKILDVKFDYIHAESFFEDKMPAVIKKAIKKGLVQKDQGALIIRIPGIKTPLILNKSDGATTYETRDLAAIKFWKEEFKPDLIAYEVGSEQAFHFQQLFAVAEMLGYMPKEKLIHIQHGLYLGKDGKKMRTRSGGTVKLEEVLDEAIERARKLGEQKDQQLIGELGNQSERQLTSDVVKDVGIGAIKYFDLSHHPSSNIVFDWEQVFQMEGNSAPYLQYTYARGQSILEKAQTVSRPALTKGELRWTTDLQPEEVAILRHFYKFGEVVAESAEKYSPNLLCEFLFELAQRYNTFYNKHRILGNQVIGELVNWGKEDKKNYQLTSSQVNQSTESFRLAITQVTGNILKTGLNLLGIKAPKRM